MDHRVAMVDGDMARASSAAASAWIRQIKMPFFATLPSFFYEQDLQHPSFLRFKEARAVHLRKEYSLQLCLQDFRGIARCMEMFAARAHHSIFLFVREESSSGYGMGGGGGGAGAQWVVRGFRLTRHLELQEETDEQLVLIAWREFLSSPVVRHAVDDTASLSASEQTLFPESICNARCELKTRVSVPSWSSLSHYASHLSSPETMQLLHRSTCNLFSDQLDVPILIPRDEIIENTSSSSRRVRRRLEGCLVAQSIQPWPVMPKGWYRKNLIGARIHSIDSHRKKSTIICEMLDGRFFRYKEHFPDTPYSRAERKGFERTYEMLLACEGDISNPCGEHDDVCPTPCLLLARLAREKKRRSMEVSAASGGDRVGSSSGMSSCSVRSSSSRSMRPG